MKKVATERNFRRSGEEPSAGRVMVRKASYNGESLRKTVFSFLDNLCADRIEPGTRVLVKPNLLSPNPPESAVLTHPLVVKAVVEYIIDRGARPVVSDSPGTGSFGRIIRIGGFADALAGLDVEIREFKESGARDIGEPFGTIEMAKDLIDFDVVVNLPKLKTHSQMLLTLAVKNTFGCVVGLRKVEWHMKAGVDRDHFGRLLVQIHRAVAPAINILDGILALEGDGPGKGGTPRHLGLLMASTSGVALDMAVCTLLGLPTDRLPTNRAAGKLGLIPPSIELEGALPLVDDFQLPEEANLIYGPKSLHSFLRKHLLQRPVLDRNLCILCAKCAEICPADAISMDNGPPLFAYDRCIRCYCCIEVCPEGALAARNPPAGRLFQHIIR